MARAFAWGPHRAQVLLGSIITNVPRLFRNRPADISGRLPATLPRYNPLSIDAIAAFCNAKNFGTMLTPRAVAASHSS